MTMKRQTIPVLAAPLFDPAAGRIDVEVAAGLNVTEIVISVLPGLTEGERRSIRVALVTHEGSAIIEEANWHRVRPRPGVHVVIRVVPGRDALRSILSIVVAVAAAALSGGALAGTIGTALGIGEAAGSALVSLGVTALGNLAINALIPPPEPDPGPENKYTISGWRNRLDPDGAIPVPMGKIRFAPPFACRPFTEIVNGDQYVVSLFLGGYGRLLLSDFRIGETSIAEYDEVEIEVREGVDTDDPISLIPRQTVEETVGTELTRLLPRDDLGEIVPGQPGIEKPVTRATGSDAAGASVIFAWPAGLVVFDDKGRKVAITKEIKIEHRLAGSDNWQEVIILSVVERTLEAFYRQHIWDFPSRGRWEVRVTMMTDERGTDQTQERTVWAALQTLRPEYPLNIDTPMALVALRIKATDQLNGQLDNFNMLASRVCPDFDAETEQWIDRETSNEASLYRFTLQGSPNAKPALDTEINLEQLVDWHAFCEDKGLKYDRVMDDPQFTLRDALTEIAAAGRASPRHDGVKWGVTIDRPQELVVDHINPRNSEAFSITRSYFEPPHALRIKFKDATNDYQEAERYVRWPGYEGPISLTEQLEQRGKTDPDEIYREGLRRIYETIYRPDSYRVMQDGPALVATRGDLVMASHYVIDRVLVAARISTVSGRLVEIDAVVEMVDGQDYGIRFRVYEDRPAHEEPDTIGRSVVRGVLTIEGETSVLTLEKSGDQPKSGDLIHFGPMSGDSIALIVTEVEAGDGYVSQLRLMDAAPIIDELTDAAEIPSWSGQVGAEISDNFAQPSAPRFTGVQSGLIDTGNADLIVFQIEEGGGAIRAGTFEVEHRIDGGSVWEALTIPVANGGGEIADYESGDPVELRAKSVSATDVSGPYTPVLTLTVGSKDAGIPTALDDATFALSGGLGGFLVGFATGDDANTSAVQIYRSFSDSLDRETDASGTAISVDPNRTYEVQLGDGSRANLIPVPSWSIGPDWTEDDGAVTKTAGSTNAASLPLATEAGKFYRFRYQLSAVSAGSVTAKLVGGSTRNGLTQSTSGFHLDRIQAVTGNHTLRWGPDTAFSGVLSDVTVFQETASCLDQGLHYIWIEPQNEEGVPGPVSGPIAIEVV
jgi:hypothetical protein